MRQTISPKKCLVTKWVTDKGYGFLAVGGRRAFVHVSDIRPEQDRGVDLSGQTLVVYTTEEGDKGLRVARALTLAEHEQELIRRTEEERQVELQRVESQKTQDAANAKVLEFRVMYPKLLKAWKDEFSERVGRYLLEDDIFEPIDLEPYWIRIAPWDLAQEVRAISNPFTERLNQRMWDCISHRWETIRKMGVVVAQEIELPAEVFAGWFNEVITDRKGTHRRWLRMEDAKVMGEIRLVLTQFKRDLAWKNAEPVRDRIIVLAQTCDQTHGMWSRADLSGLTMEKLANDCPKIIAAYLGGSKANVISGIYGDSGEEWSHDLGTNIGYGSWEIRPDLAELIREGRSNEALWKVRREIAAIEAPLRRDGRANDHAWARWVLARTPLGTPANELVTSEGWNFPPQYSIYKRAQALAVRILEKHPKLHASIQAIHKVAQERQKFEAAQRRQAEAAELALARSKKVRRSSTSQGDHQEADVPKEKPVPSGLNSIGDAFAKLGF